jgi:hypothetical protein
MTVGPGTRLPAEKDQVYKYGQHVKLTTNDPCSKSLRAETKFDFKQLNFGPWIEDYKLIERFINIK